MPMIWSLPCGGPLSEPECTSPSSRSGLYMFSTTLPVHLGTFHHRFGSKLHRNTSHASCIGTPLLRAVSISPSQRQLIVRANSSSRARISLLGSGPRTGLTQPHASSDKQLSFADRPANGSEQCRCSTRRTRRKMGREPPLQRLNRRFPVLASIRLSSTFRAVVFWA